MLILLQLLKNALDGFANEEMQAIQRSFSNQNILSLDNFSDQWLVNAAYEEVKEEPVVKIIIIRNNEAEFNNLKHLLYQLPQLNQVKIFYFGIKHPLLERMGNFKNIRLKMADLNSTLTKQAKEFFST